ncbi:MAG: phosphoribosylaminoimidazolesuccinocarboxamide synthase, partial [Nanoarchaeota archaeon]|nr:phosphoribosylaminoimidazolesuccinocarboxamide synthase [Nanoarchaeota archaeon]
WLFEHSICSREEYAQIRNASMMAFGIISEYARQKGLIFVDTKTEHGITRDRKIVSADELYTLDSSRWWLLSDYEEQMKLLSEGEIDQLKPKSYSKEFARQFSKGDQGYTDEQRLEIAVRYIIGIQHLLGKRFEPDMRPRDERVVSGLETVVERLAA